MAALKLSYKTLDSIFENDIAMAICRKPETYPEVPYATGIRRLRIKKGINHPALNIWFEYDEETVTLIDVDRVGVDEKD